MARYGSRPCRALKADAAGKVVTVSLLAEGDLIGVLLAASRTRKSPVAVEVLEALTVLFLPLDTLTADRTLLYNILRELAEKGLLDYHKNRFRLYGPPI